jgi:uncharacterized protein Smg (DUF494 family)
MYDRIVEIIVYLVSQLKKNKPLADIDIGNLTAQGYTDAEVSSAFNWLFDQLTSGTGPIDRAAPADTRSHRIFHDLEKMALSKEAQGYLLQVRELALIDDEELELIIERVMMAGYSRAGVDDVKPIAAAVMFGTDEADLPGSLTSLGGGDTIQ